MLSPDGCFPQPSRVSPLESPTRHTTIIPTTFCACHALSVFRRRPAQRRIAALAAVYQAQMVAEDAEKEDARAAARRGKLMAKREIQEAAEARAALAAEGDFGPAGGYGDGEGKSDGTEEDKGKGKWTVDGKYFFATCVTTWLHLVARARCAMLPSCPPACV